MFSADWPSANQQLGLAQRLIQGNWQDSVQMGKGTANQNIKSAQINPVYLSFLQFKQKHNCL